MKPPEAYIPENRLSEFTRIAYGVTPAIINKVKREGYEVRMKTPDELENDPTSLMNPRK